MRTRSLSPADRAPLEALLGATGAFTAEEVEVALELIDLGLGDPPSRDYLFVVAEDDGRVTGYACWGPVPLTEGVFDLYWIAVDPGAQKGGVGRRLMDEVEAAVRETGGRMVLVETAGKPSYAPTRAFYERIGYREVARIPDFYRRGDDKVIYGKVVEAGDRP
ncbi:MAG: GNAT family N-acetyltransferase [Planctomycetes bacterium]|nr:GNAT family N-acetyltransferase [Planctomycetota bacterium]